MVLSSTENRASHSRGVPSHTQRRGVPAREAAGELPAPQAQPYQTDGTTVRSTGE